MTNDEEIEFLRNALEEIANYKGYDCRTDEDHTYMLQEMTRAALAKDPIK